MLKFLGSGSAFNTKLGNNSAYIIENRTLLLIDCGSSTFKTLLENNVLEDIDNIYVLITHTHPDHIGSLGDLIFYSYYSMGEPFEGKITLLHPSEQRLEKILDLMGVKSDLYNIHSSFTYSRVSEDDGLYIHELKTSITPIPTEHVEELECYGYILTKEDEAVFYSGDSCKIPEFMLHLLINGEFNYFYQDTCRSDYNGNVHLSLRELCELVPQESRHLVYCMHLDEEFDRREAEDFGFNVVNNEFVEVSDKNV